MFKTCWGTRTYRRKNFRSFVVFGVRNTFYNTKDRVDLIVMAGTACGLLWGQYY